jgi:transketolase
VRNAFVDELVRAASERDDVVLMVGDLGYSVVEPFADRFPDRFINAGVAEQNMMGVAAGMASEGMHVFVYSIGNFPTFRCAEQLRNDVDYHRLPVTVVSVGGGLAYGNLGYSHHTVQDYALLRAMPNLLLAAPGDPMEVRACVRYLVANPQPSYLRLGKAGEPSFHERVPTLEPGVWLPVRPPARPPAGPGRRAILSTGATLELAVRLAATERWADHGVWSLPLWGSRLKPSQAAQLAEAEAVLTLEDHLLDGGFGSWMLEAAAAAGMAARVSCRGLDPRVCGTVGSQATLNALGGLRLED